MRKTRHEPGPWSRYRILLLAISSMLYLEETSQAVVIFQDTFEYVADRNATNVELPFRAAGWIDVKANNSYFQRGGGYLYTQPDIQRNSRVLTLEALPSTVPPPPGWTYSQTDYWIGIGSESSPLGTVPANVWFQFRMYVTPESRWHSSKWNYPCRTFYPCPGTGEHHSWLSAVQSSNARTGRDGDGEVQAPPGGWFFLLRPPRANNSYASSWNADKLFENLTQQAFLPGIWYDVRIHLDTSGPQGAYELWARRSGESTWTKRAEWIGGVTTIQGALFAWPTSEAGRSGHRQFRMPTTTNQYDSTTYLDDFIMATSVHDLEGSSGDTTPPEAPRNLRIVQ